MSNPQNNPNSGQRTTIQSSGWITKFKVATRTKTLIIGMGLFGGVVNTIEFFVNISQFPQAICSLTPFCPPSLDPPKWIGVKIEDVYIKKLRNYELETSLFVTDKSPYEDPLDKDVSVIRNVDQDLSKIGAGKKQHSGQYEAVLRTAKNNRKPVCLKIYGRRHYPTSEFFNIIDIKDFPDSQNYDSLKSEKRNKLCTPKTLER